MMLDYAVFNEIVTNLTRRLKAVELRETPNIMFRVMAPAPTGLPLVDTLAFTNLVAGTHYQLQAGTYIINPTVITTPNVGFFGVGNGLTTIKLAGQAGGTNAHALALNASGITFENIVGDGNSSTVGSGVISGPGFFDVVGGSDDCSFTKCRVQNTGGTGIYAYGYQTPINNLRVEDCWFTNIGRSGAGNGGCCVFLDGGVNDAKVLRNRAYGVLTSNFIKIKSNTSVNCYGALIQNNTLDYTTCTTFDGSNHALGIELFNGAYDTRCIINYVLGPNTIPIAGHCWGISCGDARGSVVSGNIIKGGTNIRAMAYGIEVAECPGGLEVSGNQVSNCDIGSNATNNNPEPSHAIAFIGNTWQNCYTGGVTTDSAPSGVKFIGDTFIDCGVRYLFYNSFNQGGGDGTVKDSIISDCTFQIKDQTRLDPSEARIFAIYVGSADATKTARVSIDHCNFGFYPGGASTIGLNPLETASARGVKFDHCNTDGARPSDGAAQADRTILTFNGDFHADHNTAVNFVTEFCALNSPATLAPLSTFEFNNVGSLGITAGANAPYTNIYWDLATGRLHVRNSAGTDAAVGP